MIKFFQLVLWLTLSTMLHAQLPFEADIQAFEAATAAKPPVKGGIVLYGSSTMRMWSSFETDLATYPVCNRGFGGSQMSDALLYFDRVVVPLQPSLILLYEGDNDIEAGESPQAIFDEFKALVKKTRRQLPGTKIAVYTLRPSIAREKNRAQQQELNALFRAYCKKHRKHTFLIECDSALLAASGRPNGNLLAEDHLHLNDAGYKVWTQLTLAYLKQQYPRK